MNDNIKKLLEDIRGGLGSQKEELSKLSGQMVQFDSRMTALEKKTKVRHLPSLPGSNEGKDKGRFSFQRAIVAIATGDWSKAQFERDVFEETKKRQLAAGSDTAGGFLVPVEQMTDLIELLRAETVVLESGATLMGNLSGSPVEVPKQTTGATGFWVAENASITQSEQAFGQVTMTPKQASALTQLSNRVLRLSNPGIEAVVRNDLALVLARLIDLAALRGIGSSNQPLGVANTPGINTVAVGTNGGPITYALMVDIIAAIEEDNALRGRLQWIFHPNLRREIAKLLDADSRPLFTWDPSQIQPTSNLIGYPWKTTTQIPVNLTKGTGTDLTELYFANWQDLLVGQWGGMSLDASRETSDAFAKNQTHIRIIQEVDVAVRHEESFCLLNDADSGN